MNNQYVRGSEWRRWELHLHTPFTKKEDRFVGETPEDKWNNFYRTIDDYIGDGKDPLKNISAIAITDYLSVENYLKVESDKRLPSSVKLLLPNVELRMKPIARDSPINIHCIFSPELAEDLEERFFGKLEFMYNDGRRFSAAKSELISLGREYSRNIQLPDEEAHKVGLNQYVFSQRYYQMFLRMILNSGKRQLLQYQINLPMVYLEQDAIVIILWTMFHNSTLHANQYINWLT